MLNIESRDLDHYREYSRKRYGYVFRPTQNWDSYEERLRGEDGMNDSARAITTLIGLP